MGQWIRTRQYIMCEAKISYWSSMDWMNRAWCLDPGWGFCCFSPRYMKVYSPNKITYLINRGKYENEPLPVTTICVPYEYFCSDWSSDFINSIIYRCRLMSYISLCSHILSSFRIILFRIILFLKNSYIVRDKLFE